MCQLQSFPCKINSNSEAFSVPLWCSNPHPNVKLLRCKTSPVPLFSSTPDIFFFFSLCVPLLYFVVCAFFFVCFFVVGSFSLYSLASYSLAVCWFFFCLFIRLFVFCFLCFVFFVVVCMYWYFVFFNELFIRLIVFVYLACFFLFLFISSVFFCFFCRGNSTSASRGGRYIPGSGWGVSRVAGRGHGGDSITFSICRFYVSGTCNRGDACAWVALESDRPTNWIILQPTDPAARTPDRLAYLPLKLLIV